MWALLRMRTKVVFAFFTLAAILTALFFYFFFRSGFGRVSDVYICDYSLSQDGKEITIRVGVSSSVGFVRKAVAHQQDGGRLCVDFYAPFGGINSRIGAQSSYTLPLREDTTVIAVYRHINRYADYDYEDELYKDADGVWHFTFNPTGR